MNNAYESTVIVDAHLSNEQIESIVEKYSKIITDSGGTIKLIDRWGKRRLAYEVAKKQYGYYICIRFDAEGSLIKSIEREYKLDDHVIRYLTISVPKAVVEQEKEPKKDDTDAELVDSNGSDDKVLEDEPKDIKTDDVVDADEKEANKEA